MAIAYDTAVLAQANAVTTNTFSVTGTGTNLVFNVASQFATGTDISGVPTYNGANCTLIISNPIGGAVFDKAYAYYQAAPASGAHNCVINNTGGANYIYAAAGSYTGASQTSPIGASAASVAISTGISQAVTTTADNSYLVGFLSGGTLGSTLSAGAATTLRTASTSWNAWIDSNAAKTPIGSYSLAGAAGGAEHLAIMVWEVKLPSAAVANSNFFMFM